LALREVVQMNDLVANASTERLHALAAHLRRVNDDETVIAKAARTDEILAAIEQFMEESFNDLLGTQEGGRHRPGDLVWRKSGWGIARAESLITKGAKVTVYWRFTGHEALTMANGFFVNYRLACQKNDELAELNAELNML
jgi:hypothetical protein